MLNVIVSIQQFEYIFAFNLASESMDCSAVVLCYRLVAKAIVTVAESVLAVTLESVVIASCFEFGAMPMASWLLWRYTAPHSAVPASQQRCDVLLNGGGGLVDY